MIAIVVVGYNRPDCIQRLLSNLSDCNYDGDKIDLIISIDKGERQSEIINIADSYKWGCGDKRVRAFKEKQGLRTHIFSCGELTKSYDAVILLEDDILVSRDFYRYAKSALSFYGDDERIAGISLYKHRNNVSGCRYFEPCDNGSDAFLIQYAQSWGQCWNKRMWGEFYVWYSEQEDSIFVNKSLPSYLRQWKSSWLKYNIAFCILQEKYFVYPYTSLSTNCSEVGEHATVGYADYQVPILYGSKEYTFFGYERCVRYDGFFERNDILDSIHKKYGGKTVMDLFGRKNDYGDAQYLITVQPKPYQIIDSYSLSLRPHEQNVALKVHGNGIYVYNLLKPGRTPKYYKNKIARYDLRDYPVHMALSVFLSRYVTWLSSGICARFKRLFRL